MKILLSQEITEGTLQLFFFGKFLNQGTFVEQIHEEIRGEASEQFSRKHIRKFSGKYLKYSRGIN